MNNNMYQEQEENVLEKYGRDITESSRNGKIDPVIGRDEEIRSKRFERKLFRSDWKRVDAGYGRNKRKV